MKERLRTASSALPSSSPPHPRPPPSPSLAKLHPSPLLPSPKLLPPPLSPSPSKADPYAFHSGAENGRSGGGLSHCAASTPFRAGGGRMLGERNKRGSSEMGGGFGDKRARGGDAGGGGAEAEV